MAALQSVVLTDRTPVTPVNHTFVPRDVKNGTGLVVNTAGVPVGEEKLTISMRKTGSKFRGSLTMALPVVQTQTINGVSTPVVVRTAYVSVSVTFDDTSTTQERTNTIGMLADAFGTSKTLIHKSFVDLEGVYGS